MRKFKALMLGMCAAALCVSRQKYTNINGAL